MPQVLDPVDEAVGHHVLGHLHLLAVDRRLRVLGEERHERTERERVHDDADVGMPSLGDRPVEPLANGGQRGGPLLVVGRVHVDVERLGAGRLDRRLDLVDVGKGRPEVEMDADDLVAGLRERDRGRLAHARRATEDQGPALAVVGHRVAPPGSSGQGVRSSGPSLAGGPWRSDRRSMHPCTCTRALDAGGWHRYLGNHLIRRMTK